MSDNGPTLRSRRLWAKRESKCLTILERGLLLLREGKNLPEAEVDLNRILYGCLLKATSKLYPKDDVAPALECNNQPDYDDESRTTREQKRPDIQWIYRDHYEANPLRSSRQFVVECKRLGKPIRADRVFNSNYVNHGINRFRDTQWGYAQGFPRGAMVGYWQSMELKQVLNEINAECHNKSLPDLRPEGKMDGDALNRFQHTFDRPFIVSPFELHHVWVKLDGRILAE